MKHPQAAVLVFGYDQTLLETRQWVLQTRGYRATVAADLAAIEAIPVTRQIDLLLVCHSVPVAERETALDLVQRRWPGCRYVTLAPDQGRMPSGILGTLLHTMDGPGRLIALVGSALQDPTQTQARAS